MKVDRINLTILGTGFAAFSVVKNIDPDLYNVVVVSPRNHFLFTPLLPSTTVGTIEFRSIIEPIRVARRGIKYYQASCTGIHPERQTITCEGEGGDGQSFELSYDRLVIAVGARSNTFGVPGVEEHAFFLKELADARAIRKAIIACFEKAAMPDRPEEDRRRILHFAVVGGGPTGVEFAAELEDFVRDDIQKWYPAEAALVKITLFDAAEQILSSFDSALSAYTARLFRRENIDVRTGVIVEEVRASSIRLKGGEEMDVGLIVWSTGIGPTPLLKNSSLPMDKASRLLTDEYLNVVNTTGIYGLGDNAEIQDQGLPATSQVAQQQGKYLARTLNRMAKNKTIKPFRYRHLGMLAYVGKNRALADLPHVKGRGFSTFLFWRSAYITKLVSFKNKVLVLFDWFKALFFGRDISHF